ncbi:LAFA_0C10352g1_1 [Lachancea sp. 'fantastica']|nr:LAFA_0C10352g1_1 [Lachancea sp. 'fantastica']
MSFVLDSSDNSQVSLNPLSNGHSSLHLESASPTLNTRHMHSHQYMALPFMNNYVSGMRNELMNISAERRKADNERTLMTYYSSKLRIPRQDSVTSGSTDRSGGSGNSKKSSRLKHGNKSSHQSFSEQRTPLRGSEEESKYTQEVFYNGYKNYCSKLPIPSLKNTEVIRRHNMWIPFMRWDLTAKSSKQEGPLLAHDTREAAAFTASCLNTNVSIYRDTDHQSRNMFVGSTTIPPLFGEMKLPPFVYQCTVDVGDKIYTLGGLTPSYYYTDEMPDLSAYQVDGVPNLPPPLLDSIVNNPSMVNNHDLYVISSASSRVVKPVLSGHVPPPLLCMTGSALTKRHIFYYGGFEIKTETRIDDSTGKFCLKKRAVLSNRAYILDALTCKFTKVDLVTQPTKFNSYPSIAPRFGHSQVSVKVNSTVKCAVCATAMSADNKLDVTKRDIEMPSSPLSQPIDEGLQSENSSSIDRNLSNKLSISTSMGVSTILVMGGYCNDDGDDYEPLNDLWKIEVTVIARGKRNYYKFAETALATPFSQLRGDTESGKWPPMRAFHACEIYENDLLKAQSSEEESLENLRENFMFEPKETPQTSLEEKSYTSSAWSDPREQHQNHRHPHHQQHHHHSSVNDVNMFLAWNAQKQSHMLQSTSQTLVIHGGSNKSLVLGDLWWFDLDTEKWTQIKTYKAKSNSEGKCAEINLTLVGHKLVRISAKAIFLGGLAQCDVDRHWVNSEEASSTKKASSSLPVASLYLLDLHSFMFEPFCVGEERRIEPEGAETPWHEQLRMISTSATHRNGFLQLIGGLLCSAHNLENAYLRGTFTTCILPLITTPQSIAL